jgi:hypothetical protein
LTAWLVPRFIWKMFNGSLVWLLMRKAGLIGYSSYGFFPRF